MAQQKPTKKGAPAKKAAEKNKASDKNTAKKAAVVGAVAVTAAAVAASKTTKKNKKKRSIAIALAVIFIFLAVGGGLGWWFLPATVNFYYVDDSQFEYGGYEPELLDTAEFRLFTKTTLEVSDYFESDDIDDWAFEWYSDSDCVTAARLSVGFGDLNKTKDLYCVLVYEGTEGGEVELPTVTEDGYPAYGGDYYNGIAWTAEGLYARLRNGFKATTYDFAGKGGGLISADTPHGEGYVYGIYNNMQFEQDWKSGKNFEREHVWCNSLLGMARVTSGGKNQASDLHNLRAIGGVHTGGINQTRSNRYFTDCPDGDACNKDGDNDSATHPGHTVGADAFYPGRAHIGDVSRILMYMIVMYKDILRIPESAGVFATAVAYSPAHAFMPISDTNLLSIWNNKDPVDGFEMHRNDVLYGLQGNRNPFIDYPNRLAEVLGIILAA